MHASTDIDTVFPVREVEDGKAVAGPLFWRRYRLEFPDFPKHVVGFWQAPDGVRHTACYVHFTPVEDILLAGGACSDNRLLRRMPLGHRDLLRAAEGIYCHTLRRAFDHFRADFSAVFGYSGDTIGYRRAVDSGFEPTPHRHLLVNFLQPLDAARRQALVERVHAMGPF